MTPGGVRYFDKVVENTCSPFNPCSPQPGDFIKLKYKSFLSNGQMYDSSEGPGRKPLAAKYKANPPQLLPGWEEALDGMQMGQTRIIQVPPGLAYGSKGLKIQGKDGAEEFLVPPDELHAVHAEVQGTSIGEAVRASAGRHYHFLLTVR